MTPNVLTFLYYLTYTYHSNSIQNNLVHPVSFFNNQTLYNQISPETPNLHPNLTLPQLRLKIPIEHDNDTKQQTKITILKSFITNKGRY